MVSVEEDEGGNTKWSCVFKEEGGQMWRHCGFRFKADDDGSALVFHFAALFVIWIISPAERFLEPMLDERTDSGDGDFVGGIFFGGRGRLAVFHSIICFSLESASFSRFFFIDLYNSCSYSARISQLLSPFSIEPASNLIFINKLSYPKAKFKVFRYVDLSYRCIRCLRTAFNLASS